MTTDNDERDLKSLFDELKVADACGVASFGEMDRLNARPRARGRARELKNALAAGFILLLTVVILAPGVFRRHLDTATKEEQQWASFSNWEAATDTLLAISSGQSEESSDPMVNDSQLPSSADAKNL